MEGRITLTVIKTACPCLPTRKDVRVCQTLPSSVNRACEAPLVARLPATFFLREAIFFRGALFTFRRSSMNDGLATGGLFQLLIRDGLQSFFLCFVFHNGTVLNISKDKYFR